MVSAAASVLAMLGTVMTPTAAQEPDPIPAGVAPPPGVYAPGVDVVHYEVEVGLGLGILWFEANCRVEVFDGPLILA